MREIKFRFYDLKNKSYEDLAKVFLSESGKYVLETISPFDAGKRLPWADNVFATKLEDVLAIEQYTGRVDAHGTKIFEGDIVQLNHDGYDWFGDPQPIALTDKVMFDAGAFWIGDEPIYTYPSEDMQVVGNIHENQELLEDE